MREIVYLQAGNIANHIGTHFWNTEEAYFHYDDDGDQSKDDDRSIKYVDHDVSFREGLAYDGSSTYCPRLLVFDSRDNFGARARINDLYEGDRSLGSNVGPIEEVIQPPIEPSTYQKELDSEYSSQRQAGERSKTAETPQMVRYWSDYNRVYWSPRTMHPVYWGTSGAGAVRSTGKQMFDRIESETNVTEDSLRLFVEECDLLQGFQATIDTTTFGSFMISLLECMHEEYPKTPILSIVNLSDVVRPTFDNINIHEALDVIGDAFILRDLSSSLSSITIPLQSSSAWRLPLGDSALDLDASSVYHTSALLSAHLESVTMPFRAKHDKVDMHTFCNQLNARGDTRITQLLGLFPIPQSPEASYDPYDFSVLLDVFPSRKENKPLISRFSQRAVVRTDVPTNVPSIAKRIATESTHVGLDESLLFISSYPAYPMPSSYPHILRVRTGNTGRQNVASLISSLTTTSTTSQAIMAYARYVSAFIKGGDVSSDVWDGIGKDELRELSEDLIKIGEAYWTEIEDEDGAEESADFELDL
ncbi:mtDNA inheritance, partitioning of the mitochondrial organelle [Tulasnella sp. JGI-2019a]|nr:mtDNA inheritance, partitioning of the mitochondrial organelle [Tulasnella sp. JGI-2019a]